MLRICSLIVLTSLWASAAAAQTVTGPARVIDGDTIQIATERIRLHAVDTPETGQVCRDARGANWDCGAWATDKTVAVIAGQAVTCTGRERDRYARLVATCRVAGRDLGAALVDRGVAVALPRYGRDYVAAENRARRARRGLWAGSFQRPEAWRAAARNVPEQNPPGVCAIKGNISSNGRIYHLPGQRDYDRTRIATESGERWFCSAAEAKAAGWRAARS